MHARTHTHTHILYCCKRGDEYPLTFSAQQTKTNTCAVCASSVDPDETACNSPGSTSFAILILILD